MEEKTPLVSIIVRTKDRPKLLKRALQSIFAQTYRPIEVVLVNDGGCDLPEEELKEILGDVSLNYICLKENRGRAVAGNVGIENAKGEFIGFLDDDDEFYPEHVSLLCLNLQEGDAKVCYSDCEVKKLQYNDYTDSYIVISKEPFISYDFDFSFLLFSNYIPLICTFFHRDIFRTIGNFDESFELYEDWDFLIRVGIMYGFKHIRKITTIYNKWSFNKQITQVSIGKNFEVDGFYYKKIINKYKERYTPDALYKIYDFHNHMSSKLKVAIIERERLEAERERLEAERERPKAERERLEGLLSEQENRIYLLVQEKGHLSTILSRIYSSRGWRLLTEYYGVKEFIIGTDISPDIAERARDLLKRTTKRFLPKKVQIFLKQISYQIFYRSLIKTSVFRTKFSAPYISIVIPVYNRSAYLRQAIDSALNQDYKNYEVIAIDDFSTELEGKEILTKFSRNSKFRAFYNDKNIGISETLNEAILKAKGDYIAFLDCDDLLPENALHKASEIIMANEDKGYFYSDRINVDIHGRKIEKISFINRKKDNYLRELLKGMFTDHLKIIRKDSFLDVGLLDKRFDSAQDYEFALRYSFKHPEGFCYINDSLYHHRTYDEQMSSSHADLQEGIAQRAREKIRFKMTLRKGLSKKQISIVILSFNKKEHTVRCINSIKETVNGNCEIILFDNGSNQQTVDFLQRNFRHNNRVKMVFSSDNLGCPRGRKKAISYADGNYIITLDNDIVVTQGWFEELILSVEEDSQIAGSCCKVIFPDNKVQYNGGRAVIKDIFVEFSLLDAWKNAENLATMIKYDCDWIPGGATLYKRAIYEKVTIGDEYENAYEDNDFSFNVKKLGFRLVNCPTAKVIHNHVYYDKRSAVSEKDYMESRYDSEAFKKSMITFYKRHGLIIKDEYLYKLCGLNGLGANAIKNKFIEMVSKRV